MPVEQAEGKRRGSVLYHQGDGYFYVIKKFFTNSICVKCSVSRCKVRGSMAANPANRPEIITRGVHDHPPEPNRLKIRQLRDAIVARATMETSSTREIIKNELQRVPVEVATGLNRAAMSTTICVARRNFQSAITRTQPEFADDRVPVEVAAGYNIASVTTAIKVARVHSRPPISPTLVEQTLVEDDDLIIGDPDQDKAEKHKNSVVKIKKVKRNTRPGVCQSDSLPQQAPVPDVPESIASDPERCKGCSCSNCCHERACVLFLPCHHQLLCRNCSDIVTQCPECRTPIERKMTCILSNPTWSYGVQ